MNIIRIITKFLKLPSLCCGGCFKYQTCENKREMTDECIGYKKRGA